MKTLKKFKLLNKEIDIGALREVEFLVKVRIKVRVDLIFLSSKTVLFQCGNFERCIGI